MVMGNDLTQTEVVDIHSNFDVETGERIEGFTVNKNLEKACQSCRTSEDEKWAQEF